MALGSTRLLQYNFPRNNNATSLNVHANNAKWLRDIHQVRSISYGPQIDIDRGHERHHPIQVYLKSILDTICNYPNYILMIFKCSLQLFPSCFLRNLLSFLPSTLCPTYYRFKAAVTANNRFDDLTSRRPHFFRKLLTNSVQSACQIISHLVHDTDGTTQGRHINFIRHVCLEPRRVYLNTHLLYVYVNDLNLSRHPRSLRCRRVLIGPPQIPRFSSTTFSLSSRRTRASPNAFRSIFIEPRSKSRACILRDAAASSELSRASTIFPRALLSALSAGVGTSNIGSMSGNFNLRIPLRVFANSSAMYCVCPSRSAARIFFIRSNTGANIF